ncbi:MAG: hypothetical protein LBI61_02205 [Puniceicoccales bacterium]|jgi:hypothetical protein|nr:hypothetical protein [Puniceicoccales bacterium]
MFDDDRDRQLGKLLRLKKLETPPGDRWLEFDSAFENKLLSAVGDSRFRRLLSLVTSVFNFKRTVFGGAGVLLLLVAFSAMFRSEKRIGGSPMSIDIAKEYVKFASDDMFARCDGIDVESGICSMDYADDGVEYVHDMLILRKKVPLFAKM